MTKATRSRKRTCRYGYDVYNGIIEGSYRASTTSTKTTDNTEPKPNLNQAVFIDNDDDGDDNVVPVTAIDTIAPTKTGATVALELNSNSSSSPAPTVTNNENADANQNDCNVGVQKCVYKDDLPDYETDHNSDATDYDDDSDFHMEGEDMKG